MDESLVTRTLYVDPAHTEAGDDDKHGTADAPFATLNYACQAAAKAKDANVGVKVVLAAGTYREAVIFPRPAVGRSDTDAPLIIEAAEREQATIDGADAEGWTPSTWKSENGLWTHPWPFVRGATPHLESSLPPGTNVGAAYRPGDLIFVNGTAICQVNTKEALVPGSFWDPATRPPGKARSEKGRKTVGATVVVQLPADMGLEDAIVQVGARPEGLVIDGRRNVVLRGLLCQHAARPSSDGEGATGLEVIRCSNVLVEDVLSQWNDGAGLTMEACRDVTLRRVRLLHNGATGLVAGGISNLLVEDCEASFNRFRSEWAGWIVARAAGAVEAGGLHGSTWRRFRAAGNAGQGLRFANDEPNLTIEDAVVTDNLVCGLDISDSDHGPVLVRRCLVTGTKSHPSVPEGAPELAGVALSGLTDVTLESCVVVGNAGTQLSSLWGIGLWPFQVAARQTYHHNVFAGSEGTQMVCVLPTGARATDKPGSDLYYGTLVLDENCYWNPALAEAFMFVNPNVTVRPQGPAAGVEVAAWWTLLAARNPRLIAGRSLWQDPLFANPSERDFRLQKASPVADWDLPSDDASAGQ